MRSEELRVKAQEGRRGKPRTGERGERRAHAAQRKGEREKRGGGHSRPNEPRTTRSRATEKRPSRPRTDTRRFSSSTRQAVARSPNVATTSTSTQRPNEHPTSTQRAPNEHPTSTQRAFASERSERATERAGAQLRQAVRCVWVPRARRWCGGRREGVERSERRFGRERPRYDRRPFTDKPQRRPRHPETETDTPPEQAEGPHAPHRAGKRAP